MGSVSWNSSTRMGVKRSPERGPHARVVAQQVARVDQQVLEVHPPFAPPPLARSGRARPARRAMTSGAAYSPQRGERRLDDLLAEPLEGLADRAFAPFSAELGRRTFRTRTKSAPRSVPCSSARRRARRTASWKPVQPPGRRLRRDGGGAPVEETSRPRPARRRSPAPAAATPGRHVHVGVLADGLEAVPQVLERGCRARSAARAADRTRGRGSR